jgi:hypothetical protein
LEAFPDLLFTEVNAMSTKCTRSGKILLAAPTDIGGACEGALSGRKRKGEQIGFSSVVGPQLTSLTGVASFIPENLQGYLNGVNLACLDYATNAFQYHDCGANEVTKEILFDPSKERVFVHQASNTLAHIRFVKRSRSCVLDIWNMSTDSKVTSSTGKYKECMLFFSTDGSLILNWYENNRDYRVAILNTATAEPIWEIDAPDRSWRGRPDQFQFSADSQHYLVIVNSQVVTFSSMTGDVISELPDIETYTMAVNEFGRSNICALSHYSKGKEEIQIRDFITNELKCVLCPHDDEQAGLETFRFVNENRLAYKKDLIIQLWDISTVTLLFKYVHSLSALASWIASTGNDTMFLKSSRMVGEELKDTLHVVNSVTGEYLGAIENSDGPICGIFCGQPGSILL